MPQAFLVTLSLEQRIQSEFTQHILHPASLHPAPPIPHPTKPGTYAPSISIALWALQ